MRKAQKRRARRDAAAARPTLVSSEATLMEGGVMADGDARVTYHDEDEKWAVAVEGAAWAASRHDKRTRAVRAGRAVAEASGSNLIVEGTDGRTQKRKRDRATKEGACTSG